MKITQLIILISFGLIFCLGFFYASLFNNQNIANCKINNKNIWVSQLHDCQAICKELNQTFYFYKENQGECKND